MLLSAILKDVDAKLPRMLDVDVVNITDDSRQVEPGWLFIAVRGSDADGHNYIQAALKQGAAIVVCEHIPDVLSPDSLPPAHFVVVPDSRTALVQIAGNFYHHPAQKLKIIGTTGTNGKTSVTKLTADLLSKLSSKPSGFIGAGVISIGDDEYHTNLTTPGTLALYAGLAQMVDAGCEYCAMEVSSHSLDQQRVGGIQFAVAAFTNLTQDHLDYHKTMENYYQAKKRLFSLCDYAVINIDDEYGARLYEETICHKTAVSIDKTSDHHARNIECGSEQVQFIYEDNAVTWRVPGKFSVYNALTALAIVQHLGYTATDAANAIEILHPAAGRMETVPLEDAPFTAIVDFAHTPDAIANAIQAMQGITKGKVLALFGCGGNRDRFKRPLMTTAALAADHVYLTSDNPRYENPDDIIEDALNGITDTSRITVIPDRTAAITAMMQQAQPDDVIMVLGKGDEPYLDIQGVKHPYSDRETIIAAWQQINA